MFLYSVVFIFVLDKRLLFINFNAFAGLASLCIDLRKANLALPSPSKLNIQIRQMLVRYTALQAKWAL